MKALLQTRASVVWLVLVALTLVSWTLGTQHRFGGVPAPANLTIMVVAVFKVRLIGLHFMELRDAPWLLRGIFEAFCVVLLMLLSTTYLLA